MWDETNIEKAKTPHKKNSLSLYVWEKFILFQNRNSNSEWEENTPAAKGLPFSHAKPYANNNELVFPTSWWRQITLTSFSDSTQERKAEGSGSSLVFTQGSVVLAYKSREFYHPSSCTTSENPASHVNCYANTQWPRTMKPLLTHHVSRAVSVLCYGWGMWAQAASSKLCWWETLQLLRRTLNSIKPHKPLGFPPPSCLQASRASPLIEVRNSLAAARSCPAQVGFSWQAETNCTGSGRQPSPPVSIHTALGVCLALGEGEADEALCLIRSEG